MRDYCLSIPLLNVSKKSPRTSYQKEEAIKGDLLQLIVETRLLFCVSFFILFFLFFILNKQRIGAACSSGIVAE